MYTKKHFSFTLFTNRKGREWARREAFRFMERKNAEGTNVYINPDFIALDKLIVPTDEEMEAVESEMD